MPATISIGVIGGYSALAAWCRSSTAASQEGTELRLRASAIVGSSERSVALFGVKRRAIEELEQLASDCSEPGWDGHDAEAVSEIAKSTAEHFIRVLPEDIPLPEFSVEPDGAISLDWIRRRGCVFSLSVGRTDRLAFAWLDGTDRGHGVARFTGEQIPGRILEGIRALFLSDALLRAA